MARRLCILTGLFILFAGTAPAQTVDARKALEAACQGHGRCQLEDDSILRERLVLANRPDVRAAEDWPHYEVADYTRVIDFDAKWSREDYTRRQGKYPTLGRTPMPEQHVTSILSGNYAWDMKGMRRCRSRGCISTACHTPICGSSRSC